MNWETFCAGLVALISAAGFVWKTYKAQAEANKKNIAEKSLKTVITKHDGGKIFRRFMLFVEQKLDGFNKGCGLCGGNIEECSPSMHEQKKLDETLKLMLNWCKDHEMDFDYVYWVSQYNEERFFLDQAKKYDK